MEDPNIFFADSVLHIVASENLDITQDLSSLSDKPISELLDEAEKEQEQEQESEKDTTK